MTPPLLHHRHLLLLLLLLPPPVGVVSEPTRDREALLTFYSGLVHSQRFRWSANTSACKWRGVTCNSARTAVLELRLPGKGLIGRIPYGSIALLSNVRVISLRYNQLSGPIPSGFGNLTRLRALYLQHNSLSGRIPQEISRLPGLARLNLAHNDLSGEIPAAFENLKALKQLLLNDNRLTGGIPHIDARLDLFNVSYNRLHGSIPTSLSEFPASSFAENLGLCGQPLLPCASPPASPPSASSGHRRSLPTAAIIGIAVAGGMVLLLLVLMLLICLALRRRRRSKDATKTATVASSSKHPTSGVLGDVEGGNKLVFFENGPYSFDLEDLLRASAEVLGKGSFGTSYKAVLEDGTSVVVKRMKDVVATNKEFEQQMQVLGRVRHDNIVPLRAYYYSKDEKLLVYDHLDAGSLSATLHGSRPSSRAALDWRRRARAALAVARGIFHLHCAKLVHGDVKASNVLLGNKPEAAALSDSGLWVLFRRAAGTGGGYRAPEVLETGRATAESDVYSFGVVLLELLTGRAAKDPITVQEETADLPRWVRLVVREEWTGEVFEAELVRYGGVKAEEEMLQVLQVAMACVEVAPERRPGIEDVVRLLEVVVGKSESSEEASKDASDAPSPVVPAT